MILLAVYVLVLAGVFALIGRTARSMDRESRQFDAWCAAGRPEQVEEPATPEPVEVAPEPVEEVA